MGGMNTFALGSGLMNLAGAAFMPGPGATAKLYALGANSLAGAQALQTQAINQNTAAADKQAQMAITDAAGQAAQVTGQAMEFRENQAEAFNNSGVLLQGSPIKVLESTRQKAAAEVQAIMARGTAQASLLRTQAMIAANQGRAGLLGQQIGLETSQAQNEIQAYLAYKNPFAAAINSLGAAFQPRSGQGGGGGGSVGAGAGSNSLPSNLIGDFPGLPAGLT